MGIERHNFEVAAGATFMPTIRWGTEALVSRAITGISRAAPAVVTAVGHSVPAGWPVAVVSAGGMTQINSRYPPRASDYHPATVLSADTISINEVNSADYTTYTSGGFLVYHTPMSLVGVTARMIIRDAPGDGTVLETLTELAGITLDTAAFTITPRLETADLTWTLGYYDLELTDATTAVVVQLITGVIAIQ